MGPVPQRQGNREWFVDRRAPERRLQVTWHNDHRTAVLSIWHGDICTGTFQLPIEDAARLIAHLADGLADAGSEPRPALVAVRASMRTRLLDRFRHARADILPFRRR
jgi:hypothetical protein